MAPGELKEVTGAYDIDEKLVHRKMAQEQMVQNRPLLSLIKVEEGNDGRERLIMVQWTERKNPPNNIFEV